MKNVVLKLIAIDSRSSEPLAARLEVVRGSWKGLQNPFPVSVQTDVHLGMFNQ